jgi:serine/threonine-protein kinase
MSYEIMQAHIKDIPPLPKSVRAEVSGDLQRIILTAMAKNPQDRFQTAHDLHEALKELRQERVAAATQKPTEQRKPSPTAGVEGPSGADEREDRNQEPRTKGQEPKRGMRNTEPGVRVGERPGSRPPSDPEKSSPGSPARSSMGQSRVVGGMRLTDKKIRPGAMAGKRPPAGKPRVKSKSPKPAPGKTPRHVSGQAPEKPVKPVPKQAPKKRPEVKAPMRFRFPVPARKLSPLVLVITIAAVVGVVVVGVILLAGRGTRVPDFIGKSQTQAVELARQSGLVLIAIGMQDDTLPEGHVVRQAPAAGVKASKSDSVRITTSTGLVQVPNVVSIAVVEATERLVRVGLRLSRVDSVYSDRHRLGEVIRVNPASSSRLRLGSSVRLTVAFGRATCSECGTRRERGARFCMTCGHRYEF